MTAASLMTFGFDRLGAASASASTTPSRPRGVTPTTRSPTSPRAGERCTYLFVHPALVAGDYSRYQTGVQHLACMVENRTTV
jgi:hypothetical protein